MEDAKYPSSECERSVCLKLFPTGLPPGLRHRIFNFAFVVPSISGLETVQSAGCLILAALCKALLSRISRHGQLGVEVGNGGYIYYYHL